MPNFLFPIVLVLTAVSLPVAIYQSVAAESLRSELRVHQQETRQLEAHIDQLENNLQSAGLQMSNLASIAQEATERAAQCQDAPDSTARN